MTVGEIVFEKLKRKDRWYFGVRFSCVNSMAAHPESRSDVILSILGSLILFSTIWCGVEGRGNLVLDSEGTKAQVCKSRECIDAANFIFTSRDTSVEPCNNFYEFVCGGWIRNNPVPENKTSWDLFQEASEVINQRLKEILEKGDTSEDNRAIKNARKFYQACLDVDNQSDRNVEILLERLAAWGGWPLASKQFRTELFDWKKLMIHLRRTNNLSPFLQINIGVDRHNTSQNILKIDQGDVNCGTFLSYARLEAWTDFFFKVARFVTKAGNQTVPLKRLNRETKNLLSLHLDLCKNLKGFADKENDIERDHVMTIKELQNMTDKVEPMKEHSKINWLDLLRDFLEGANIDIDEDFEVAVQEPDFVRSLIRNIDKVSARTVANYLLWNLVYDIYENVSPELRQFGYDLAERVRGGTGAVPRWQTCVDQTNTYYSDALGYEYVKLYFDEDAKKNAKEVVSNILDSFIEELRELDWMDGETRAAAIEKAENLVMHVGYPESYDNVTNIDNFYSEYVIGSSHILNVENIISSLTNEEIQSLVQENDRDTWISQVAVVNAFYSVEMNSISMPAGIFQPPFYVKGRPEALNYGAIGAVIGHEISHAFDAQGRMADKFGNLAQWWSADTLRTYMLKKKCIEDQYNEYPVPELLHETAEHVPSQLDGSGTVSENIADNGGLQEAYAAYLRSIHQHGTEPRLPGLTHYSPQQLFFIGYTSVWCESGSQKSLVRDIETDSHSPSKYRVLIPLGNSKNFADAWKCRQNDFKMNPVQKCEFW